MAELTGRALIASRCAKFFKNGDFVNLGIGVPLMCRNGRKWSFSKLGRR